MGITYFRKDRENPVKGFDAVYHREHSLGFCWLHESFGTNWRMTAMQAAGCSFGSFRNG
ncbi:MAG: hypothetical protein Q8P24_13305 [Desulfobacterales bacterium]|nr:hypothetical protein [Desulfobacterales bacterium]